MQIVLCLVCFPFFTIESLRWLKTVTMVSLGLIILMGFMTWLRGPGYIERDPDVSMMELL